MVRRMPSTSRAGLMPPFTSSTVRRMSASPSSAKYSHWSGTMTPSAATRPFSVRSPSDGGQSMMTCSYSPATAASASRSRDSRRSDAGQLDLGADQVAARRAGGRGSAARCGGPPPSPGARRAARRRPSPPPRRGPRPAPSRRCPAGRGRRAGCGAPPAASDAARFTAVVVLPTPPFWLAMVTVLPMSPRGCRGCGPGSTPTRGENAPGI